MQPQPLTSKTGWKKEFAYPSVRCKKRNLKGKARPNKACSREVGFAAIYRHFPRPSEILLSSRVSSRPLAANANR